MERLVAIGMKYTKENYWEIQVEQLKSKSNRELEQLQKAFSVYKTGALHNYYEHIRKEYASRVGKRY